MFNIGIELNVPDHSGVAANFIYELPNSIGIRHDANNSVHLCAMNGVILPFIMLNNCYATDLVTSRQYEIKRAFIEAYDQINCITGDYSNFFTVIGKENFEVIGASVPLPGMSPIGNTGVYANPNQIYMAQIENGYCLALLKRDLLSNGFRFKVMDQWYCIINDATTYSEQPTQTFQSDRVYGFIIDNNGQIYAINEAGTIY